MTHHSPALLGNPITEEFQTRTGANTSAGHRHVVQYYESVALVYLPDEAPERQVQLLALGREEPARPLVERPSAGLRRAPRRTRYPEGMGSGCAAVGGTAQAVRGPFLTF